MKLVFQIIYLERDGLHIWSQYSLFFQLGLFLRTNILILSFNVLYADIKFNQESFKIYLLFLFDEWSCTSKTVNFFV